MFSGNRNFICRKRIHILFEDDICAHRYKTNKLDKLFFRLRCHTTTILAWTSLLVKPSPNVHATQLPRDLGFGRPETTRVLALGLFLIYTMVGLIVELVSYTHLDLHASEATLNQRVVPNTYSESSSTFVSCYIYHLPVSFEMANFIDGKDCMVSTDPFIRCLDATDVQILDIRMDSPLCSLRFGRSPSTYTPGCAA
jgi:hypothetical protein